MGHFVPNRIQPNITTPVVTFYTYLSVECDGDAPWRPLGEDEPKVSGGRYEGVLVRRLCLVLQTGPVLGPLWHDGVAQRQQPEELLGVGVASTHLVQKGLVVKLERPLVHRVGRKVHTVSAGADDEVALALAVTPPFDRALVECHDVL